MEGALAFPAYSQEGHSKEVLSWDLYDKCKAWKGGQRTFPFQGRGDSICRDLVWERALTEAGTKQS